MPIHMWLIEHDGRRLLVDTGATTAASDLPFIRYAVTASDELPRALSTLGMGPSELDTVILTHLHSDHADGAVHAPGPVLVSDVEWRAANSALGRVAQRISRAPIPEGVDFRPTALTDGPFGAFAGSLRLTEDGRVRAVATPGHTAGHLSASTASAPTDAPTPRSTCPRTITSRAPGSKAARRSRLRWMSQPGLPLPTDDELTPEAREVLQALPPLNVFRAVAALPASFRPFMELGGSILAGDHLTPAERELVILRVAHLTNAPYERQQHEQLARAVGIGEDEIEATASASPEAALSADGALLCRAAGEITLDVRLSDRTLAEVRERWGDRGTAELVLTVGYYNMVSRFLESTRVPLEKEDLLTGRTPGAMVDEGSAAAAERASGTD
jgi:alkylhydroperoxidase family enzyme